MTIGMTKKKVVVPGRDVAELKGAGEYDEQVGSISREDFDGEEVLRHLDCAARALAGYFGCYAWSGMQ